MYLFVLTGLFKTMKILKGKVISNKMLKTLTIVVENAVVHPIYKKRYIKLKKYQVHSEKEIEIGKTVRFEASKPYSKLKKWKVLQSQSSQKSPQKAQKPVNTEEQRSPRKTQKKGGKKS